VPAAGAIRRRSERREDGLIVDAISTDALPLRDRYPFWKEAVCGMFVGLDCTRSAEGPFQGSAACRVVPCEAKDSVSFIEVASVQQKAVRTQRQISRDSDAWLMLLVQSEGPGILHQNGRTAVLGPGDMVLFDSTRGYSFDFADPFRQLVVKIPHQRLASRLPPPSLWLGRAIPASSMLGKVLASHIATVSASIEAIPPAVRPGLVERMVDLIAYTFAGVLHDADRSASTARRVLLARAMQYVDSHIHDCALAPADVAAALGISVGYLHRLFQGVETSVSGHIRERRLAGCRDQLASKLHAGEHITEIAMRWGFNDLAHFSRAFRARHGMAPRDYRAEALGKASTPTSPNT
jgi:AraC-like DNA-binding protein